MKTLELFQGEALFFIIRSIKTAGSGLKNMVVNGVLLDMDEENYYIGEDTGEVMIVLRVEEVSGILTEKAMAEVLMQEIEPKASERGDIQ